MTHDLPGCFLQVKSLADSMDDTLTCQSGRGDSQEESGEGLGGEESDDFGECVWINPSNPSLSRRRLAERERAGGVLSMHEDSTATSYSDVMLYMDDGMPSSPLSLDRAPSSTDTEYWAGIGGGSGGGMMMAGGREDSRDTEGAGSGNSRRSTPCTECRDYRLRGPHLPVLTIEPPSDSSVDMSDRSDRGSLNRQLMYEQEPPGGGGVGASGGVGVGVGGGSVSVGIGGSPQGTLKHSPNARTMSTCTAQGQTRTPGRPLPSPIPTPLPHHTILHHHHHHHHHPLHHPVHLHH